MSDAEFPPMSDADLDDLEADMESDAGVIRALTDALLAKQRRYRAELARRNPPATVHEFPVRPSRESPEGEQR